MTQRGCLCASYDPVFKMAVQATEKEGMVSTLKPCRAPEPGWGWGVDVLRFGDVHGRIGRTACFYCASGARSARTALTDPEPGLRYGEID